MYKTEKAIFRLQLSGWLVIFFILCSSNLPAGTFSVTGTITDTSGTPLQNVKVGMYKSLSDTATDCQTFTGSDGRFVLRNIPSDHAWLKADLPGYRSCMQLIVRASSDTLKDVGVIRLEKPPGFKSRLGNNIRCYDQFIANVNVSFGWRTMGEIAIGAGDYESEYVQGIKSDYSTHKIKKVQVGCEYNFSTKRPLIGPNIKFDVTRTIVAAGWNIIYYTDFNYGTFYLRPRVGFSIESFCNFMFGFNIPLSRNYMWDRVNHFNFSIEVPLLNWGSEKADKWNGEY